MKPAPFKYIAASSLAHALSVKAEYDDEARFLAGGQSLIPAMNFRLARPAVLIDINGLTDLAGIDRTNRAELRLGALTRYRDFERDSDFLKTYSLFADALPHIAHPQIRNRGTIGGNLSHADPASELPASAVATSLIGQPCTTEAIEAGAAGVRDAITPSGNVHATPDYQRHIAGVLAMRAIGAADQRAHHAA